MGMKAESAGIQASRVREERLHAARRVIQAGKDHQAELLLVTGDIFEDNAVDRLLVRQVGEILRAFPGQVVIIPGNHDPLVPGSVWEHAVWQESANIVICREEAPIPLDSCILYPCPLRQKYSTRNPTAWIAPQIASHTSSLPAIGLAHGNVEGLPSLEPDYPIPRSAAAQLGLDYLALGHWHSFARYEDTPGTCRMAYAGTHETTKFGERDSGNVLLIEIAGRGSVPLITPIKTGGLSWVSLEAHLQSPADLAHTLASLNALPNPASTLVRLQLGGILFLENQPTFDTLKQILQTRFLHERLDTAALAPAPTDSSWIDALPAGPLRETASRLQNLSLSTAEENQRNVAIHALLQLFDLQRKAVE